MDLNKDNKNIYTVDSKSYSKHMEDNWKEPSDLLGSFIKVLLVLLLLVFGYFFYKIVKADLSFTEVFNKQELLATYEFLKGNEKVYEVKEDYVEALAVKIVPETSEITTAVLSVSKKYDEVVAPKKEEVKTDKVTEIVVLDEVEIINIESVEIEVQKEKVVELPRVEVMALKEEITSTVLSETYLERMVKELNSL